LAPLSPPGARPDDRHRHPLPAERHSTVAGILLMLLAVSMFSLNDVLVPPLV